MTSAPAPFERADTRGARRNARRDEILRAAGEMFFQKGYDATTTQDIADVVGMLKGSLYYYISSKEDLLYEIIDGMHTVLSENLDVVSHMRADPLVRVWSLVYLNVVVNAENLLSSAVFVRDFGALTGERREHILRLRDLGDRTMRDLIREAKVAGRTRDRVDEKVTATAVNTMCNALYRWYDPHGPLAPDALATSFADIAVASVASNPALVDGAGKSALAWLAGENLRRT